MGWLLLVAGVTQAYISQFWHFSTPNNPGPSLSVGNGLVQNGSLILQSNYTNGRIAANITQPITFGSGTTFVIRMKLMSESSTQFKLLRFAKRNPAPPHATHFLMDISNNSLYFSVLNDSYSNLFQATSTPFPPQQWATVTLVCQTDGPWTTYFDGQLQFTIVDAPTLDSNPRWGTFFTGFFDGLIDFFWIRSRSLTSAEVLLGQVDIDLWTTSWSFQSEVAMLVSSPDITLVGNPDLTGGVLNLDTTDQSRFVSVTNPVSNFPANDSFSIYFRFKSQLNQTTVTLFEFSDSIGASSSLSSFYLNLQYIGQYLYAHSGTNSPTGGGTQFFGPLHLNNGEWIDLTVVETASPSPGTPGTYKISFNGVAFQSPSASLIQEKRLVDHPFQFIGRSVDIAQGFLDGAIERMCVFRRALQGSEVAYLSLLQALKTPVYLWDFSSQISPQHGYGIDIAQRGSMITVGDELSGTVIIQDMGFLVGVVMIRMRVDLHADGANIFHFVDEAGLPMQLWLANTTANPTICFQSGGLPEPVPATCCQYNALSDPWFTLVIITNPFITVPNITGHDISLNQCGAPWPSAPGPVLSEQFPRTRFGGALSTANPSTNATFSIDYIAMYNTTGVVSSSDVGLVSNALDNVRVHCLEFIVPSNLTAQGVTMGTCLYGGLGTECELGCQGDQQPLQSVIGTCTANNITSERAKWDIPNLAAMKCVGEWTQWLGSPAPNLPPSSNPRSGVLPGGTISFYPRISPMKICPPSTYVVSIIAGAADFLRQVYMWCSDGTVLHTTWNSSSTSFSTWKSLGDNPTMVIVKIAFTTQLAKTCDEVGPTNRGWTPTQLDAVYYRDNETINPYIVGLFTIQPTSYANTTQFISNISDFTTDNHTVFLRGFQTEEFPDIDLNSITSISRLRFFFSEVDTTITPYPTTSPITSPTTSSPTASSTTSQPTTNTPTTNTPTITPTPTPRAITMAPTVPGTTIVVRVGDENGNGNGNGNGVSNPSPPPGQAVLELTVEINNSNNNISTEEELGREIASQVLQALYVQYTLNNLTLMYPPHVTVLIPNTTQSSISSKKQYVVIVIVNVDESVAHTITSSSLSSSSSSSLLNVNGYMYTYKISSLSIRWPSVVSLLKSLSIPTLIVVIVIFVVVVVMVIGGHMRVKDMKGLLTFISVITTLFSFALSLWFFAVLKSASQSNDIIISSSSNSNSNSNNFSTITTQDGSEYKPYFIAFTVFLFLSPLLNGCVLLIRWRYILTHDSNLQAWMDNHPLLKIMAMFLSLFSLSNFMMISSSLLGHFAAPIAPQTRLAVSALGVWGGVMELPKLVIQFMLIGSHSSENAAASAWLPLSMSALAFFVGILQRCYALGYLRGRDANIKEDLELKGVR